MVAEPMVNDDPLATLEPTVAGNDEETNGEELFFRGSVEKRLDRIEKMLRVSCRGPQFRTEQKLKPDRKTEVLQLEPTYDIGVLSKWFQEKGYGFATVDDLCTLLSGTRRKRRGTTYRSTRSAPDCCRPEAGP